jgi:nucleoid-associated protein EbfC
MSSMRQLMKQAQEMQARLQRELNELVVEASVGGGMVTVRMSGHKQLVGCRIDPEAMDPKDPSMLEDLIVAAVNEASRKIGETMQGKMGSMAASLPGLFYPRADGCPNPRPAHRQRAGTGHRQGSAATEGRRGGSFGAARGRPLAPSVQRKS